MPMRLSGLVCVFRGHRWAVAAGDAPASAVRLCCERCGSEQHQSDETYYPESDLERFTRSELAQNPFWDPSDDPRLDPKQRH